MEEITESTSQDCSFCKEKMAMESVFCQDCGFPENGTEKEVAVFYGNRAMQKNKNVGAEGKIKSARNTLYVIAGIILAAGLFRYFINKDIFALSTNFALSFIYLLLASWTSKKPLMAILLGLLLYITTIIISAILEPATLVSGILWKVIIISYLAKGVYSASSIKEVQQPNTTKN